MSHFPPVAQQRCGNCYYARPDRHGGPTCRVSSPLPDENGRGYWPNVRPDDWCGEWAPQE